MRAILKRELESYFYTPVGYVFIGVFLAVGGVLFAVNNLAARSGDILSFLWMMGYVWMLLAPVLTMRALAGERRAKTDQLLLTAPVTLGGVVLGKFFAAVLVLCAAVAFSLVYVLIVALYGRVYWGEALTGYLGFFLQGCAFIALDLLVSGLNRSPVTAATAAFGVNLLLWLSDVLNAAVDVAFINRALDFVSLYKRYEPFRLGQLGLGSTVYYLAFTALMLFLTVRTLDKRRWSEA